jgi:hypothetical protein
MKPLQLFLPLGFIALVIAASDPATPSHQRIVLDPGVYTEGASFGDVNGDGHPDLLAGPFWWEGPDFKTSHRYRPGKAVPARGYQHNSFLSWVRDLNGDGRADLFQVAHDGRFHLDVYLQPEKPSENWPRHRVAEAFGNESPELTDLDGDGTVELVAMKEGRFGLFRPDPTAPTEPWTFQAISPERTKSPYYHGLGLGDLNGDGQTDLLEKEGWYEAPDDLSKPGLWNFHRYPFSRPGGAQMLVFDVDGDGDNDVVSSTAAHAWGLAWFENHKVEGRLTFRKHVLVPEDKSPGVGGVTFTQAHSLVAGDFNGDGLTDFATGKRYFAHNGGDPDADKPAVLYVYELVRDAKGARFVPRLIDTDSGAGTQLAATDVNKDGTTDLGVGNKKGVFVFRSTR